MADARNSAALSEKPSLPPPRPFYLSAPVPTSRRHALSSPRSMTSQRRLVETADLFGAGELRSPCAFDGVLRPSSLAVTGRTG